MTTILSSIEDKYAFDDNEEDYGFIVFVSNSPETKKGMFPPIMTLCDYDIEFVGTGGISPNRLSHIAELDLTDNMLSDWSEITLLLKMFPSLEFLNLSNNMLNEPMTPGDEVNLNLGSYSSRPLRMRKLVLNGNKVDWKTANTLARMMPRLHDLYLSANNLGDANEDNVFQHDELRQLFLSCNSIEDFASISIHLGGHCPSLEYVSFAECPIKSIPETVSSEKTWPKLQSLNLSTTKISDWAEVDRLRAFPNLKELRLQHCPVLAGYSAHERRMLLVARLPNIQVLNGGGAIPNNEREDAERAFIRFYNDVDPKPPRYAELVSVHGHLDPLVNIDMQPDLHVKVNVVHKEESREEVIKVYQTVQQFKNLLQQWFSVAPQNMKLYYCDKDLVEVAGPEEMKWPQKELYTYNVQNGDKFILDEKVSLGRLSRSRTTSSSSMYSSSPNNNNMYGKSPRIAFSLSPRISSSPNMKPNAKASKVARNLFGKASDKKGPGK